MICNFLSEKISELQCYYYSDIYVIFRNHPCIVNLLWTILELTTLAFHLFQKHILSGVVHNAQMSFPIVVPFAWEIVTWQQTLVVSSPKHRCHLSTLKCLIVLALKFGNKWGTYCHEWRKNGKRWWKHLITLLIKWSPTTVTTCLYRCFKT